MFSRKVNYLGIIQRETFKLLVSLKLKCYAQNIDYNNLFPTLIYLFPFSTLKKTIIFLSIADT